ncbi:Carboxylesterase family [Ceratobasidium sp. AG-Ba]|nr:Carboxylesterase family [Ceratobasidium sp. AG-Ba]QRW14999.1 Carboxylesterase family [Ceratobasidium sp. AG-Ba]
MRLLEFSRLALLASSVFLRPSDAKPTPEDNQLVVKTTSGTLIGLYNATNVRAFLGVRYAYPPTGDRRFAAPVPFDVGPDQTSNATSFGYTCPGQYYPGTTIYTMLPFLPFSEQSEDCLTLNVWAPTKERIKAKGGKLPVLIHAGYFTQGGSAAGSTDATNLVANNDVVVINMNYRLSVLGFPNYGSTRNAGLLDQRVALEWARNNAAQFGGDPSRITLIGQSAGGISADIHMFAKWKSTPGSDLHDSDPIARAVVILSGGVFLDIYSRDSQQVHFGQLGAAVGCNTNSSKALLDCMRGVPAETLINEIVVNGTARGWNFAPVPDEQIVFSNYTDRILKGKMSKVPTLMSTLENEATGLVPFDPKGINETLANQMLYQTFVCPASKNSNLRSQANITTYRFRYAGNFTNISPYTFLGAYHGSELPMLFGGATPGFGGRNATTPEDFTSYLLQSYLLAFANDPKKGLSKLGWPKYKPGNDNVVVISPHSPSGLIPMKNAIGDPPMVMVDSSMRTIWALRRRPVSQLFYDFGIHCATHQIRVILICGFVITSLFYPAITIYFSHQPLSHFSTRILDSLFLPSANDAFHHNDLHDLWQGYDPIRVRTDAAARARCGTEHTVRVERLFIPSTTPDPYGALNTQTLIPALEFQQKLEKHLTPELPCVKLLDNMAPSTPPSHRCLVVSPTAYWNDDAELIGAEPHLYLHLNKAHRNVSRGGIPLTPEMALAGRLTTDHAGYGSIIESSKFLSVSFFFREDDCHSNAGHAAWIRLIKELIPLDANYVASGDQPKLLALEFAILPQPYSSWVSIALYFAYLVLFVQLSGSMRRMDSVHSRLGLTFTGMVEILASTITSVSVCAIAGFRVTMVPWSILPIVIVIVGAENMFVLMEAVLATPLSLPVRRRIAEGIQKAGVSITIKLTMYNAVLGTIGYFASGAIRQFCVFVIVVLVAHWFLIHTFFLAVLSIDLQRLELSDVLRQGSSSPKSGSKNEGLSQRGSGRRFGIRMGFKTRAARNVLSITGGLYYYSGSYAASRLRDPVVSVDHQKHTEHHLTPTQSVSTPFTVASTPQLQPGPAPTSPALLSTPALIWRTLNPPNDPLMHLRIEPPTLIIFPSPPGSYNTNEKNFRWTHRIRQLRPVLWTLKVLVLPIAATLGALYGLLLHLLRNSELRAAQHDRIDSLVEGEAEERERKEEDERKRLENNQMEALFSTLPRASKSDLDMVQCSCDGSVVAAVSAEGVVLVWSIAKQESSPGTSPGGSGYSTSGSESHFGRNLARAPMVIPVPIAGARITSLGVDNYGKTLAVAGGGAVQIWDISRGYPLLGKRLSCASGSAELDPESAVRDLCFLHTETTTAVSTPSTVSSKPRAHSHFSKTRSVVVVYEGGNVIEWDLDNGQPLKQVMSRCGPGAQAGFFLREKSAFVAFLHPDGQIDVQRRSSSKYNPVSYAPLLSLNIPGVIAVDVSEWSLGTVVATLTASGHAAVWDDSGIAVVEMDLGLPLEQQPLFSASTNNARVRLLPTPAAPLPCRRCGLPAASSFALVFSWSLTPSSATTIYIRRASVLYQNGRCSCQPLSIASTLAGPRVISFGLHSGVRVVSGHGATANGIIADSEFPVSAHGLRRSSSNYGRHSFDSTSSAAGEDLSPENLKDGSGLLVPPITIGKENGHGHKLGSGSDVRWEQHAIEESCERGQWDIIGTHIVGVRRKSRTSKQTNKDAVHCETSTGLEQLPDAVLERWEAWQVDTATHDLARRTSSLSRLCERGEVAYTAHTSAQLNGTSEPQRSPHMARILRLGRAVGSRSPPLSPQPTGSHRPNDLRSSRFPRLPFTRVSSTSTSHDGLYAAFGNIIGVVQLDQPVSGHR